MKARTRIDPEDAGYTANDATDYTTNNRPDRTGRSFTISCTPLDASGHSLGLGCNGKERCDNDNSGSNKTAEHDNSLCGDW
jgi:hypothetical protein